MELEPLIIEGEEPKLRYFEDLTNEEKIERLATELQIAHALIHDLRAALIGLLSRQGVVPSYAIKVFDNVYNENVLNWKVPATP